MDISFVIPAYNESKKIYLDIEAAATFLQKNHLFGEIVVVDDGSKDHTADVAKNTKVPPQISLKVECCRHNRGKGHAVRTGMKMTRGKYVIFADSGNCVPYQNVLIGLDLLKNGACDIAHGSRKMPGSRIKKSQNLYRRICSKFFHWLIIHSMKIPPRFTDTQCGFKLYRGQVARILYDQCITNGFMFDVETILRAHILGYRIKEFPVEWTNDRDSRLSPLRTAWRVLVELISIKRALAQQ